MYVEKSHIELTPYFSCSVVLKSLHDHSSSFITLNGLFDFMGHHYSIILQNVLPSHLAFVAISFTVYTA